MSCLVGVDVICSGFMETGSMRSLGLLLMAGAIRVLPLRVTCVSHCCCLAHQLRRCDLTSSGLVQIFEAVSTCREKVLEQSLGHLSSIWPRCVWSSWKSLHIMQSIECLHIMWMMESHICRDRLQIHLERVHPFISFEMASDGEVLHRKQ